MNYTAGRITRPYSDLSGCYRNISQFCDLLVVYEHNEVTKTVSAGGQTHTHFVAGHRCDVKTLKNHIQKGISSKFDGNQDWSFKKWDTNNILITYMSKGILEPKYFQNITQEEVDIYKANWTDKPQQFRKLGSIEKLYISIRNESHKELAHLDEFPERKSQENMDPSFGAELVITTYPRFEAIKKLFFLKLRIHRPMVDQQFWNQRKAMVQTYCYDEEISMPNSRDIWQN